MTSSFFANPAQASAAFVAWALYVGVMVYAVARVAVLQGRKWYEVFGLLEAILNLILVGRVIWYLAGLAVGVKPGVVRAPARVTLAPETARQKLAEQAAEAIRAADERSAGEGTRWARDWSESHGESDDHEVPGAVARPVPNLSRFLGLEGGLAVGPRST